MTTPTTYDIHTDVKFAPLEVIEAGALVDLVEPATVTPMGDS